MARIVIVAGTEAGQEVTNALSGTGHELLRAQTLEAARGDVVLIEPWLFATARETESPVILLASADAVGAAVEGVKAGAFGLLRMPCTGDEIRLAVDRALRWSDLVRENEQLRQQTGQSVSAPAAENGEAVSEVARTLAGKPLADIEKQVILSTLQQFKGHRLRTATALGIGVRTLGMKIKRWREEGEPIAGRNQQRPVHVDIS
jgi:DNA-binding NtrC family response regulator